MQADQRPAVTRFVLLVSTELRLPGMPFHVFLPAVVSCRFSTTAFMAAAVILCKFSSPGSLNPKWYLRPAFSVI